MTNSLHRALLRCLPALVAVVAGPGAAFGAAPAVAMGHFDCRLVERTELIHGAATGRSAHLSHFTCRVSGGRLDGFQVTASNVWELEGTDGRLLSSLGVASNREATVVFESSEGRVRNLRLVDGQPAGWDSDSIARIKLATGSQAELAGKAFRLRGRLLAPGHFVLDATLVD